MSKLLFYFQLAIVQDLDYLSPTEGSYHQEIDRGQHPKNLVQKNLRNLPLQRYVFVTYYNDKL